MIRTLNRIGIGAAIALCASVSAHAEDPRGEIDGETYLSPTWSVRITAPKNWRMTQRSPYGSVLLTMVRHRQPSGVITLTAEATSGSQSSLSYSKQTSEALTTLGFRVRSMQIHPTTGAYWVDMRNKDRFLRQAYLVANNVAYSLTLSAPSRRARSQHLRAFDYALRSIRIERGTPLNEPDTDLKP